jgi:hypothetical protein
MCTTVRKLLCFSLALVFSFTTITAKAQRTASVAPALPPLQITSAHTIFISNGGGTNYFNAFSGGADRGYSQLFTALQQWNHYQIVPSPSQADLIFEIHSIAPAVDSPRLQPSTHPAHSRREDQHPALDHDLQR